MTDATSQTFDEIVDDPDRPSAAIERQADALLAGAENRTRRLRYAVREDAAAAREWGRARALKAREAVEAKPLKSTGLALGVGLLVGMLLRR